LKEEMEWEDEVERQVKTAEQAEKESAAAD